MGYEYASRLQRAFGALPAFLVGLGEAELCGNHAAATEAVLQAADTKSRAAVPPIHTGIAYPVSDRTFGIHGGHMPIRAVLVALLFWLSLNFQPVQAADDKLDRRDYEGFTVWLDCAQHGAVRFRYNAQHDTGSFDRASTFKLDPDVPAECQQTSVKSYTSDDPSVPNFERGHMVPANHLDYSEVAIQ